MVGDYYDLILGSLKYLLLFILNYQYYTLKAYKSQEVKGNMRKINIEILDNSNNNCLVSFDIIDNDIVTKSEIDVSNYLISIINDKLKNMHNLDASKKLNENVKLKNVSLKNTNENVEKTLVISGKNRKGKGE